VTDSTLTHLKIIVERAVRPVRASTLGKRKMREELLAHVSGVFEEESARCGDERAALERTALRFGNPAEVTSQLQESVALSDCIRRFWEGAPGESTLRAGLRIALVTGALALVVFFVLLLAGGWASAWPREALYLVVGGVLSVPVYLFGLAFLADWMGKALHGPAGRRRLKVALVAVGSWLFQLLWIAGLTWRAWPAEWDYLSAALIMGWLGVLAPMFPYALAQSSVLRMRRHEEWACLPID
jgi:hypothetical protein